MSLNTILQIIGMLCSCMGLYLMGKKKIACWPVWIIGNVFWIWWYVRIDSVFGVFTLVVY